MLYRRFSNSFRQSHLPVGAFTSVITPVAVTITAPVAVTAARRTRAISLAAFHQGAARQTDLAVGIDAEALDLDRVAEFEHIFNGFNAPRVDFGDMQQTLGAGENLDEGAEIRCPCKPCWARLPE